MSFHFFLSATNCLHLLTPSTWRSLSASSFHPFLALPLLLIPSNSWVKIFLGILSSSILSRWPNQLILCPEEKYTENIWKLKQLIVQDGFFNTFPLKDNLLRTPPPFLGWVWGQQPPVGQGLLIPEVSRSHTQWHTTVGRTPLDKWSARCRDLYLTTHNTHNRQTSMSPVGFEPTISAGERPKTYTLGHAAACIGAEKHLHQLYYTLQSSSLSPVVDIFLIGHFSKWDFQYTWNFAEIAL